MSKTNGDGRPTPCPQCRAYETEARRLREENAVLKKRSEHTLDLLRLALSEQNRGRPKGNELRDAELCRLRNADPKKWSWERLGRKYGMPRFAAKKAYERHMDDLREFVRVMKEVYSYSNQTPSHRQGVIDKLTPLLEAAGAVSLLDELTI